VFAFGVMSAALVDAVERRIPNRITYPLLANRRPRTAVAHLSRHRVGALLAPLAGAIASGFIGLLNAVLADQGLGDVKLAAVIGAWMAHLGLVPWITGMLLGQLLMIAAIGGNQLRRRWAGLPRDYTPSAPASPAEPSSRSRPLGWPSEDGAIAISRAAETSSLFWSSTVSLIDVQVCGSRPSCSTAFPTPRRSAAAAGHWFRRLLSSNPPTRPAKGECLLFTRRTCTMHEMVAYNQCPDPTLSAR